MTALRPRGVLSDTSHNKSPETVPTASQTRDRPDHQQRWPHEENQINCDCTSLSGSRKSVHHHGSVVETSGRWPFQRPYASKRQSPFVARRLKRHFEHSLLLTELNSLRLLGMRHERPAAFPIVEAFYLALHPIPTPFQLTPFHLACCRGALASTTGTTPATTTAAHVGVSVLCAIADATCGACCCHGGRHVWWGWLT
jgi:hypothetical protein